MKSDKADLIALYRRMRELRAVDDRLVPLKLKDLVMDGFHPYVGEEAVAVGVCHNLRPEDYVISTHRPQCMQTKARFKAASRMILAHPLNQPEFRDAAFGCIRRLVCMVTIRPQWGHRRSAAMGVCISVRAMKPPNM